MAEALATLSDWDPEDVFLNQLAALLGTAILFKKSFWRLVKTWESKHMIGHRHFSG
jgi:hypothetical protein